MSEQSDFLTGSALLHTKSAQFEHASAFEKIQAVFPATEKALDILDVGCGDGRLSEHLIRQGHRVIGLDIHEEGLAKARERGLRVMRADVEKRWPVADRTIDLVLGLDVLEHLVNSRHFLVEARRVLRPRGYLILACSNHFDIRNRLEMALGRGIVHWSHRKYHAMAAEYSHLRFFRLKELRDLLQSEAFIIDREQYNFMGGGLVPRRLTPSILRFMLVKKWPNLFSGKFVIRTRTRGPTSEQYPKKIIVLAATTEGV